MAASTNREPRSCPSHALIQCRLMLRAQPLWHGPADSISKLSHRASSDRAPSLNPKILRFCSLFSSGFFLLHSRPDVPSPYCRPPPHTVYVNMIREPVERLVSNYYYMNSGKHTAELRRLRGYINTGTGSRSLAPRALKGNSEFQLSHAKMLLREAQTGNVTLDACVARMRGWMRARGVTALQAAAATPCAKPLLSLQWPYFCGHAPNCSLGTVLGGDTSGLTRALATLKTRYLLVGLMDQFNASVAALEVLAPQFFGGLERVLLSRVGAAKRSSRSTVQSPPFRLSVRLRSWLGVVRVVRVGTRKPAREGSGACVERTEPSPKALVFSAPTKPPQTLRH